MEIKPGTEVYIKVKIVRKAMDSCREEKAGYLCETTRGKVFVDPSDILIPFFEMMAKLKPKQRR